jgi:tRNA dimethylallyltransferase
LPFVILAVDFSNKKLIVVVGPTAVGKTAVAIQLAQHFQTEIISADSRQFYREMTIGTAKPLPDELARVTHHFIDSHSITEHYDAASYAEDALARAYKLFELHDYVIVCGGSGLYMKALLEGFDDIPEIPVTIREEINHQYKANGLAWLQHEMKRLDPDYFERVDPQNPARLMRALEVVMATGRSIGSFQKKRKRELPFKVIKIGLELDREALYSRIDKRMDNMIEAGLFDEAEKLYPYRQHNALQTVGYQEIFDFMEGKYDKTEAIRLLKRNSRRYAKRQLTWFKRDLEIAWFLNAEVNLLIGFVNTQS